MEFMGSSGVFGCYVFSLEFYNLVKLYPFPHLKKKKSFLKHCFFLDHCLLTSLICFPIRGILLYNRIAQASVKEI